MINKFSVSLFDQLGDGISILDEIPTAEAPVQHMQSVQKNMTEMKFTHMLIKHLDLLYGKMLAGEISEMNDENMVEIGGQPHVQTRSWYNPGNSNVTESM